MSHLESNRSTAEVTANDDAVLGTNNPHLANLYVDTVDHHHQISPQPVEFQPIGFQSK